MGSLVSFVVDVGNINDVLGLYDHIQVFRSATINGSYVNITAELATAALLAGSVAGPWSLSGLTLTLALNEADPVSVLFAGDDPIGLAEVLRQVNAVVPDLASESAPDSGKLALTSALFGTGSSILASGSARSVLGLSATKVSGLGPTILMGAPTTLYRFTDFNGDPTYYYKTRFFSSLTNRVSALSAPIQVDQSPVLADGALATATIDLVTLQGAPVVGRRVVFVAMTNMNVPSTSFYLLPGSDRVFAVTDNRGHAEIDLVVGATVRVFIEGSQFFREIVIPNTSPFDLMALMAASPDPFSIVQAPPRPIRVS